MSLTSNLNTELLSFAQKFFAAYENKAVNTRELDSVTI